MESALTPMQLTRHCPRCGSTEVEVMQNRCIVCRACELHLFINTAVGVGALIEDSLGRLLVTVRGRNPGKGLLDFPGGFVDFDESVDDALCREVREELGLEVESIEFLLSRPNRYAYRDVLYHVCDLFFICKVRSLAGILPQDDVSGYEFLSPADVRLDRFAFPSTRSAVQRWLERKNRP